MKQHNGSEQKEFRNKATGETVDARPAKAGEIQQYVTASDGDWIVNGTVVREADFVREFEEVERTRDAPEPRPSARHADHHAKH